MDIDDRELTAGATIEIGMVDVLAYGIELFKHNITRNQGDLKHCEQCLKEIDPLVMRACDGCYPACCGAEYPIDGKGRQHSCFRALCATAALPRTQRTKRHRGEKK